MDISNISQSLDKSKTDVLSEQIITLKFLKEKKTNRTYIRGLEFFIKENLDKCVRDIKKSLGTGMNTKEIDGQIEYGFQGDHRDNIIKLLVSYGIQKNKIR